MSDSQAGPALGGGMTAYLTQACARLAAQIETTPFICDAIDDTLTPARLGTWAVQDLLWGELYMPVLTWARAGTPGPAAKAFAWLEEVIPAEVEWFRQIAAGNPDVSGGRIWPSYLGYAHWVLSMARRGPVQALTCAWAAEGSYLRAFTPLQRSSPPPGSWQAWAGNNWAAQDGFARMMGDMSVGLDEAAAGHDRAELAEIAQGVYRWEGYCWREVYHLSGWSD